MRCSMVPNSGSPNARNCLGKFWRDSGQRREPVPPARMTGVNIETPKCVRRKGSIIEAATMPRKEICRRAPQSVEIRRTRRLNCQQADNLESDKRARHGYRLPAHSSSVRRLPCGLNRPLAIAASRAVRRLPRRQRGPRQSVDIQRDSSGNYRLPASPIACDAGGSPHACRLCTLPARRNRPPGISHAPHSSNRCQRIRWPDPL